MQPETWFFNMKEIMDAFLSRDFARCLQFIQTMLAAWSPEWLKNNRLNEDIYNDMLDTCLLLRGLCQMPAVEPSPYYESCLSRLEQAVLGFTEPEKGDAEQLWAAICGLKPLVDGLWVGCGYLLEKGLRLDQQPAALSFELTESLTIKLYGYTDAPAEGSEEAQQEEAAIAELKADFERLFAQKAQQKADIIAQAQRFLANQAPQAAIDLLQAEMKQRPTMQKEAFLLQADGYEQLGQPARVIDCLMKGFILGVRKSEIRARIYLHCDTLIAQAEQNEDESELKRWKEFKEQF